MSTTEERLRAMSDAELAVVVDEINQRGADAKVRVAVNDELRRRKWPLLADSGWRWDL